MWAVILGAILLFLLFLAGLAWYRSLVDERARAAELRASKLEDLLDEVKDVAWTNRELAPDLATIIIDTIRSGEEENRRRALP